MDTREIDALVAEKVMGWDMAPAADELFGASSTDAVAWNPSEDIADAMRVVEKLVEEGHMCYAIFDKHTASFCAAHPEQPLHEVGSSAMRAVADLPLAICKAALATKGIHVDTEEER